MIVKSQINAQNINKLIGKKKNQMKHVSSRKHLLCNVVNKTLYAREITSTGL